MAHCYQCCKVSQRSWCYMSIYIIATINSEGFHTWNRNQDKEEWEAITVECQLDVPKRCCVIGRKDAPVCVPIHRCTLQCTQTLLSFGVCNFTQWHVRIGNSSGDSGSLQTLQTGLCGQLSPSVGSMCCVYLIPCQACLPHAVPPAQVNNQCSSEQT